MADNHSGNGFLKGALLGGLIGGTAALLTAPKTGKKLRQDIADGYQNISKQTAKTGKKLKEIKDEINRSYDLLSKKTLKMAKNIKKSAPDLHLTNHASFMIGGAAGAVIGAISALLVAPTTGERLREQLGKKYDDIYQKAEEFTSAVNSNGKSALKHVTEWKGILSSIVTNLSKQGNKKMHAKVKEIFDLAELGLKLLNHTKKRK